MGRNAIQVTETSASLVMVTEAAQGLSWRHDPSVIGSRCWGTVLFHLVLESQPFIWRRIFGRSIVLLVMALCPF